MKRKRDGKYTKKPSKKKMYKGATTSYVARTPGVKAITETKYFDTEVSGTAAIATTWVGSELDPPALGCLFAPTVGNLYNNREGRKTYVKKLKIHGILNVDPLDQVAAPLQGTVIRLVLYVDKQSNASQSQGEQLMGSGTTSLYPLMFQNPENFGRFQVLKDKTFTFTNASLAWDGENMQASPLTRHFKWNLKFKKPFLVNYNNTNGGTIADVVDHSFHLVGTYRGDAPAGIDYKCRTVFCE